MQSIKKIPKQTKTTECLFFDKMIVAKYIIK